MMAMTLLPFRITGSKFLLPNYYKSSRVRNHPPPIKRNKQNKEILSTFEKIYFYIIIKII